MFNVLSAVTPKLFAVIGVIYPSGSVCTCSNGIKTLKAPDTSGKAVFAIPEAGDWTVAAVDGTNKTSEIIPITEKGQHANVTLSFDLILIDKGQDNTPVTGGWDVKATTRYNSGNPTAPTVTYQPGSVKLSMKGGIYKTGIYYEKNKIDLTKYSSLKMNVISITGGQCEFLVWLDVPGDYMNEKKAEGSIKNGVNTLDVSNINGNHIIGIGMNSTDAGSAIIELDKIFLEPKGAT